MSAMAAAMIATVMRATVTDMMIAAAIVIAVAATLTATAATIAIAIAALGLTPLVPLTLFWPERATTSIILMVNYVSLAIFLAVKSKRWGDGLDARLEQRRTPPAD